MKTPWFFAIRCVLGSLLLLACNASEPRSQLIGRNLPGALLSVWGTSTSDIFVVGGDVGDGRGPTVLHCDGASWTRLDTGQQGDLWWVFGFPDGPVYMGGAGGMILRYQAGSFTRMTTPGTGTVFGIWGAEPGDVWAVGGGLGGANGAFAWRLQGDTWSPAAGFPDELAANNAIWKMYGRSVSDAWMVGTNGQAVRWDGIALTPMRIGPGESLFTVHADAGRFAAVGGFGSGTILENDSTGWRDASPAGASGLIGVYLSDQGDYAVGREGTLYTREGSGWTAVDTGFTFDESFHSVWIDPSGGVWAVGGQVLAFPLVDGVVMYRGEQEPPRVP